MNFARTFGQQNRKIKISINILVLVFAFYRFFERDTQYSEVSPVERVMVDYLGPLQHSVMGLGQGISSFFKHYLINTQVSKENVELKKHIAELSSEISSFKEIIRENQRLKELLQFGPNIAHQKIVGQIVAWDSSSDFKVLRINKGQRDGVKILSTVVTSDGLVGHVYRVTGHFADILTILDSNNRIDGIIERTRTHGILEGHGNNRCMMKYVTQNDPIILGDLVLTSGLGNIYPKGITIGKISKIEKESYGITQTIELRPSVDFGKLEEVIVLINHQSEDKKKEWESLNQNDGRRK